MWKPWRSRSKTGLVSALAGFNPGKLPLFVAILCRGQNYSTNFHEFTNQSPGYSNFFGNIGIPAPQHPDPSKPGFLRTPDQHRSVMHIRAPLKPPNR